LEVEEIKTVPFTPVSHPFVERLIGTIRREYLDHVPFWNSLDLQRKLDQFKDYYNHHRTHSSLNSEPPQQFGELLKKRAAKLSDYRWQSHCRGLFQTPISA
jgi:transposase InsO family protein